jgi:protein-S-isoprenylcysteine O-methyltransferase Ste14
MHRPTQSNKRAMSTTPITAIWPVIRLWLVVSLLFLGCIVVVGRTQIELNVWWLLTIGCWFVLDLYWAAAASRTNMDVHGQPKPMPLLTMLLIYSLYCLPLSSVPIIGQRILPDYEPLRAFGAMLCAFGVTFAIWSRRVLAENWQAGVQPGDGNLLVQHGPYSIIRHPIYFGWLTAAIGMILALGELRAVVVLFGIQALLRKMPREENNLKGAYLNQYPAYEQRVSRLVPWIW